MARDLPVGKAQQQVLTALGAPDTIQTWTEAKAFFDGLGLTVTAKRQGKTSVPVVIIKDRMGGGFTRSGDGDTWTQYPNLTPEQSNAIAPWVYQA